MDHDSLLDITCPPPFRARNRSTEADITTAANDDSGPAVGVLRRSVSDRPFQVLIVAIFAIAILFVRRPDQFLHPYVWDEEGTFILREFVEHGWTSVFTPLAGYLVLVSRLFVDLAFQISAAYGPHISAALAIAFTACVALAVAFCPTVLRWRKACAIAMLLVPTDPEVFGVALYSFWWAGILIILATLWLPSGRLQVLRGAFVAVGGLSSPLIPSVAVILIVRAVFERTLSSVFIAALAVGIAAVQVMVLQQQGVHASISAFLSTQYLTIYLTEFVGTFIVFPGTLFSGALVVVLLIAIAVAARKNITSGFWLLLFTALAIGITVSLRFGSLDVFAHADGGGPRYFFYPLILLGWVMIWLASVSRMAGATAVCALFIFSMINVAPRISRFHDALDWGRQLENCASSTVPYDLPVHYIGKASDMWKVSLTGDQCKALIANSIIK